MAPCEVRARSLPREASNARVRHSFLRRVWLRLGVMAPKKLDAPFWLDGVQFQRSGNVIHSVRGQGSKGITIKVPAAGWTEAQRDAKIRATPGFAELKASVSTAHSEQSDDGKQRPDAQTKNAVGKREWSSLGKAELAVLPQDARRVSTKPDSLGRAGSLGRAAQGRHDCCVHR